MLTASTQHVNICRQLFLEEAMKTKDAIDYFGGIKELANFLGIWPHNISRWGEFVPDARAYELEVKTEGKLKAESE
jgi:DNA-binding transcriptional regulator YdaS (Cro superfamily)